MDRRKQKKVQNWDKYHAKYVTEFELCLEKTMRVGCGRTRPHCPIAFNNYLSWFLENTRVSLCEPAYEEEILEEPTVFDEVSQSQYNRMVREGKQIPFSSMVNFVVTCFATRFHCSSTTSTFMLISFTRSARK